MDAGLRAFESEAWAMLEAAVHDRHSPLRTLAFASLGADGAPEVRNVVLREVDVAARELVFFTDARAPKCAELRAEPRASWLFYHPGQRLQLRLRGHTRIDEASAATETAWSKLPMAARRDYAAALAPGTPCTSAEHAGAPSPSAEPSDASRERFVRVVGIVNRLDLLQLDAERHRRARFDYAASGAPVAACWITP